MFIDLVNSLCETFLKVPIYIKNKFYLDHLILHLELHSSSFAMWGAAVLVEWLSPGHYLYLMLQTFMGYQLDTTATAPSILCLKSIGITYKLVPILRYHRVSICSISLVTHVTRRPAI